MIVNCHTVIFTVTSNPCFHFVITEIFNGLADCVCKVLIKFNVNNRPKLVHHFGSVVKYITTIYITDWIV